jgi:hypothetical protein
MRANCSYTLSCTYTLFEHKQNPFTDKRSFSDLLSAKNYWLIAVIGAAALLLWLTCSCLSVKYLRQHKARARARKDDLLSLDASNHNSAYDDGDSDSGSDDSGDVASDSAYVSGDDDDPSVGNSSVDKLRGGAAIAPAAVGWSGVNRKKQERARARAAKRNAQLNAAARLENDKNVADSYKKVEDYIDALMVEAEQQAVRHEQLVSVSLICCCTGISDSSSTNCREIWQ